MTADPAVWRDLEAHFRAFPDPTGDLCAIYDGVEWSLCGGAGDELSRDGLQKRFRALARRGAIAAGVPNRSNALGGWLELLREDSPHFIPMPGGGYENDTLKPNAGGAIRNLSLASAEYCIELATRAFELEFAVQAGDGLASLRRDRYSSCSWLYDHFYEPVPDPKEELNYWTVHVWRGYHGLVRDYRRIIESDGLKGVPVWVDLSDKLNRAMVGLSFDLAVLYANYALDQGLRGKAAMEAFRDEWPALREQLLSADRASREELALSFEEGNNEGKNLAQTFRRVSDHLRQLLRQLAGGSSQTREQTQSDAEDLRRDGAKARDRMKKKLRNPEAPPLLESPAEARTGAGSSGILDKVSAWEEIGIAFLSDERVQITFGSDIDTRNYAEFGFGDARNGKPNRAWLTLRYLAERGGTISHAGTGKGWVVVEKRIQEIRGVLRKHFDISIDPLPFVKGGGYQARFRISCSPSFKT